jgi:Kdo2-lipid IVA lauroyltransferase/acyltransferase
MNAIYFYLTYPFIYIIASLPFGALYKVSDILYYVFRLTGYRKKVVIKNLQNSFPDKTPLEIDDLCTIYYRYLCDLILETLKTLKMTEKESKEHCIFHNQPWLDKLYEEKRSFIIVMGHYGNWEWAGPSFTLNTNFQLVVIYRPLTNTYFEKMMVGMRTRFGTRITPVNLTLRDMVANRKQLTATAFIADQTAPHDKGYWTTFLNQDTIVFTGPEKLAIKFDYPVVFMNTKRVGRGFYEVTPELLFSKPKESSENEISETFMKRLEKEIIQDPSTWLWSHRRWKHERPVD